MFATSAMPGRAPAPLWRGSLLAGLCALALTMLVAMPAQAQFVCDPGGGATAMGPGAVACGTNATASGAISAAYGNSSVASGGRSSAYGMGSEATSEASSAFGLESTASDTNSSAYGNSSTASGVASSAFGNDSTASGVASSAFGNDSTASGASSVAVGSNASASFANSAAIGRGATTTRANQQVFGTATNTYTMSGITSAASKAAQSGPVEIVTTDANGNLASASIDSLMMNSEFGKRIGENTEGVAMAIAMGGTYLPQPGETFRLSGNWGSFEGENALAFSGAYAVGQKTFLTAGFGAGLNEGTFGGRAGVSFGW